jgi:uncharacterized paraquat-inducible protein A
VPLRPQAAAGKAGLGRAACSRDSKNDHYGKTNLFRITIMNDKSIHIIRCPGCNAANRIPADRIGKAAKCGKCHAELPTDKKAAQAEASYKMRCTECGAKNRVPGDKLNAGAKCGKCGTVLKTEELFTAQPIMVSDGNFDTMVLKSPLPVLMWAWAPW